MLGRTPEGELLGFTGVDSPYEPPTEPAMVVTPNTHTPSQIADQIISYLVDHGYLKPNGDGCHASTSTAQEASR